MIYDEFQKQAIEYINQGNSVIVSAPTGAGKTVIAEHVIADCLKKGVKVIYTAPIKALSNQKFREFQETSPDKVGILTGDVTLNAHAPVLIMTTEIFRNKILEEKSNLHEYAWIIFDEIHYLDDYERGTVWEESLIFLPDHMNVLGLSATIPNIHELTRWLESIHHRPVKVVIEEKRPVPLHVAYQCQGKIYDDVQKMAKQGYKSADYRHGRRGRLPKFAHVHPNKSTELIQYLEEEDLLPCIYFVFSRKRTEYLAEEMMPFDFLSPTEKKEVSDLYAELCERFEVAGEPSAEKLRPFIERGIGYHHAGMLPTLKEVVERIFTSRLLKVIFTTETFALGINMPARTVIFDELRKFYGKGHAVLKTRDFYQMAGRAGRRGIDPEGFVFCRVNPHYIAPEEVQKVVFSKPEKVYSQFNAAYATVLNLYNTHGEKLYDIYPKSFHHFQVRPYLRRKALRALEAKVNVLKEMGQIAGEQITVKGEFASKVYGYELMLSEMFEQGILEGLSARQLAILSLAVVYEPRKNTSKPELSQEVRELETLTRKVKRAVYKVEKRAGIKELSKRCYFHLSPAMDAWLSGASFDDALAMVDADEGEMVRFFRMSIQIMREILEAPVSDGLREKIRDVIQAINRDVIDSEKQLRA